MLSQIAPQGVVVGVDGCAVLTPWRRRYPEVSVAREVEFGRPARQLVAQSQTVQLAVLGSQAAPQLPGGCWDR